MKSSGATVRVTRRPSHARSARASTCPALYQCRLLAFTLPTTTLLRSTTRDSPGRDRLDRIRNDLSGPRAFDDHVRLEAHTPTVPMW